MWSEEGASCRHTDRKRAGTRSLQMGEVQESSDAEVAGEQCDTLQVSSETMF